MLRRAAAPLVLTLVAGGLLAIAPALTPGATTADPVAAAPAAATAGDSVLWDPGPTARCWSVITEPHSIPPFGLSQNDCGAFDLTARADSNPACWPGGATPYVGPVGGQQCPTWRFNSYGWDHRTVNGVSEWGKSSGGFDMQVNDKAGGGLSLKLVNNAWGLPAEKSCDLRETTVSYDYAPGALKRHPRLDEDLQVTFTGVVTGGSSSRCTSNSQAILTTDIMWDTPQGRTDLLSVVHYNPLGWGNDSASVEGDLLYSNHCADDCRIAVVGEPLHAGQTGEITVDVTKLLKQHAAKFGLTESTLADGGTVRAVQIVSSNRGADTTTVLSDIDFRTGMPQ